MKTISTIGNELMGEYDENWIVICKLNPNDWSILLAKCAIYGAKRKV